MNLWLHYDRDLAGIFKFYVRKQLTLDAIWYGQDLNNALKSHKSGLAFFLSHNFYYRCLNYVCRLNLNCFHIGWKSLEKSDLLYLNEKTFKFNSVEIIPTF